MALNKMKTFLGRGLVSLALLALTGSGVSAAEKGQTWADPPTKAFQVDALLNLTAGWTEREAEGFDGRPLFSIHRARIWFRGNAHDRLRYVTHFAFDRLGADEYALLQGKPFDASRSPVVQDAFLQWDALDKGMLRLTGGFMRTQAGRENATVVVSLPNQEPALTAGLARAATVGTGHGRAMGIDLGGRLEFGEPKVIYHVGVFGPTGAGTTADEQEFTQSMGAKANPLYAGSLILGYGKMSQMKGGDYLFMPNTFSSEMEFTLGASGAYQGETEKFASSNVYSVFGSASVFNVTLDGEYLRAQRETLGGESYGNTAWHARVGYNVRLEGSVVTPFVVYTELEGDEVTGAEWNDGGLKGLGLYAGHGTLMDAGIHWHLRAHNLRFGAHALSVNTLHEEDSPAKLPMKEGFAGFLTLQVRQ